MSEKRRERREFTEEFKLQIVNLFNNGNARCELIREYDLTASALATWIRKYNKTGSFKACDNRTEKDKELLKVKKENQQLKMENDILKQATLIMGRK